MGAYASSCENSPSLLFSDFRGRQKCHHHSTLAGKIKPDQRFPSGCDMETMEAVVHLWCVNCLSVLNWREINPSLKNHLIHDFLDTLYCTSHAFDEVFLLLFTNEKSRSFILGHDSQLGIPSHEFQGIVEDILRYSSTLGLRYVTHSSGVRSHENLVDFPLKTFSLCPCTRRPLYVAMYLSRPDVVSLLLKYGGRIPYGDVCKCKSSETHPLQNVMDVMRVNTESPTSTEPSTSRRERNVLSLRLLLVDLVHSSFLWPIACELLEGLSGIEMNVSIPSLKHICRTRIRQLLRDSRCLCKTDIWQTLHLPQTLSSYMTINDQVDLL